jgi:hypothetical protein
VVVTGSSASHHYSIIGDRILCIGVLHAAETNFDLRAHYIGADGGAHCTLIEGIHGRWVWSLMAKPIRDQLQHTAQQEHWQRMHQCVVGSESPDHGVTYPIPMKTV